VIARSVSAFQPGRESVVKELGLSALQVWQSLSEATGRGRGELAVRDIRVGVNVAARVADAARAGEVLVSDVLLARIDSDGVDAGRAKRLRAHGTPSIRAWRRSSGRPMSRPWG
jgi:hypothetical protein